MTDRLAFTVDEKDYDLAHVLFFSFWILSFPADFVSPRYPVPWKVAILSLSWRKCLLPCPLFAFVIRPHASYLFWWVGGLCIGLIAFLSGNLGGKRFKS